MIINPYLVQPSGPSYGTLTTAWIAATGETDLTILGALNTLETDLTTYGLTAKMKALYPFVGGTAGKHSYNFINTAAYQITWNGGITHSSNGIQGNATNGYGDTGLNFLSAYSTNDSCHLSVYSRTNNTEKAVDIGASSSTYTILSIKRNDQSDTSFFGINTSGTFATLAADTNSSAFYLGTRTGTTTNGWKNSSKVATASGASSLRPNYNAVICAFNVGGSMFSGYYSSKQYALASIGDGLNDTEAANFYTAVQAFQTTLSRQV